MKFLLLTTALLLMCSCKNPKLEKPFIVVDKIPALYNPKITTYVYQDRNGLRVSFTDSLNKYDIGDTLK